MRSQFTSAAVFIWTDMIDSLLRLCCDTANKYGVMAFEVKASLNTDSAIHVNSDLVMVFKDEIKASEVTSR